MRSLLNLAPLALAVGFLVFLLSRAGLPPAGLLAPKTLALTLLLPLLAQALADAPGAPVTALCDGVGRNPDELVLVRRHRSAGRLTSLAGMTLATGVVAGLLGVVAVFNSIAASGGQADAMQLASRLGGTVLGPIYALLLAGLLYHPAALRLTDAGSGLAEALREPEGA